MLELWTRRRRFSRRWDGKRNERCHSLSFTCHAFKGLLSAGLWIYNFEKRIKMLPNLFRTPIFHSCRSELHCITLCEYIPLRTPFNFVRRRTMRTKTVAYIMYIRTGEEKFNSRRKFDDVKRIYIWNFSRTDFCTYYFISFIHPRTYSIQSKPLKPSPFLGEKLMWRYSSRQLKRPPLDRTKVTLKSCGFITLM